MGKIKDAMQDAGLVSEKPAATAKAVASGFNADNARGYVSRIERIHDELESEKGSYMATCKSLREDIKSILDEADENGIDRRALKAVVKARAMEKSLISLRADLEPDKQETFDQVRHALGDLADLPLGAAALARKAGAETLDNLTH